MDLDDFMVTTYCLIDEAIPALLAGRRLRQRGPAPILADREVLTMEVVGDLLGYDQDQAIFQGKRRWRIESTFAQLVERYHLKQVWARDLWHVGNRLVRKVLSHTIAMHFNAQQGNPPLRLAFLLT